MLKTHSPAFLFPKRSNLTVVLLACIISLCCLNCNTTKTTDHSKGHQLGETLILNNSKRVAITSEDLKLKIDKVQDSRCPLNVNCIQAGIAKVDLSVIKGDVAYIVKLKARGNCQKTDGSCGNKVTINGYTFSLVAVTPYPGEGGKKTIKQEEYIAQVKVEK